MITNVLPPFLVHSVYVIAPSIWSIYHSFFADSEKWLNLQTVSLD